MLEIFDRKKISITEKKISGGSNSPIRISLIQSVPCPVIQEYFILIYDCGGDTAVRSYVVDQQTSLIKNGYNKIVGIRDLYPLTDLAKLKIGLQYGVKTKIDISFVIAVRETEAWFLAETNHFFKLNPAFSLNIVNENFGMDLSTIDFETIEHPSEVLDKIYQLIGHRYVSNDHRKSQVRIRRTCSHLDYSALYLELPKRIPSLKELIDEIDACF